jgi:protein gp37
VTTNWPLPNVWLGVSVESQQWADIRIPALLDTPAAVRWLSMEPLLGPSTSRPPSGRWAASGATG